MATEKVLLKSEDGKLFEVGEDVALISKKVREMMKDCADKVLMVNYVPGRIIARVLDYCLKHAQHKPNFWSIILGTTDELGVWDKDFIASIDPGDIGAYIVAAGLLEISSLLSLAINRAADLAWAEKLAKKNREKEELASRKRVMEVKELARQETETEKVEKEELAAWDLRQMELAKQRKEKDELAWQKGGKKLPIAREVREKEESSTKDAFDPNSSVLRRRARYISG